MTATHSGTATEVRVPLPDEAWLAATLYLPPGAGEQHRVPVLLEALPYRKDDLTATYRPEYVRFRDEHDLAVLRVDLRGTGSSPGIATDEYPVQEQDDLVATIAWVAEQPWCTGAVGMFGTSWSGFNSLQVAMRRPPALKAVCASYATDDRWTDDVHYYGGVLRLLDQVDYPLYMLSMNALPPVPALYGEGWREEWERRLAGTPPWQLRWLREQRRDPYWRHGSLRPGYDRITAATMLVVGWADGYRNNSLRTARALVEAGTPVSVLAGPWSHQAPTSAVPGPRVDHVPLMARWFDRHLRGVDPAPESAAAPTPAEGDLVLFVRSFAPPSPTADAWSGRWVRESVASLEARTVLREVGLGTGTRRVEHGPDLGLAAWNSCAGALPWGQPGDQRYDDARSVTVDLPVDDPTVVVGYPVVRLRVRPERERAAVAVRLCAVADDGTSLLVSRGLLNLSYRERLDGEDPLSPTPVEPGRWYDVEVGLEACSYEFAPGERIRVALSVTEWPNAAAPPQRQGYDVDLAASHLLLPVVEGSGPYPAPVLPEPPSADAPPEATASQEESADEDVVRWWTERDVLTSTTSASVDHGSTYDGLHGARCSEHYTGTVDVRDSDWRQGARATTRFAVTWPEVAVTSTSTLDLVADEEAYDVTLTLAVDADGEPYHRQTWHERIPRDLG
ncbi:MAG: CocE/NonD family hydrolase [Candidatus Nanopelagicales bacterium]